MHEPDSLTLAFLENHPAEAARVLERIPGGDAAALFATVPARAIGPVLSAMLPATGARILGLLDRDIAQSALSVTSVQTTVAILRNIAEPQRDILLEGLPTTAALTSRMLLRYPDDSVGAWADPDIVALSEEQTVSSAIARIREGVETRTEQVFLIDREQQLIGMITVHELLRASSSIPLSRIMQKPPAILSASATLSSAARRRGWQETSTLPVTDRNNQLIGVLRRAALERALARHRVPVYTSDDTYLSTMLARGYWDAISGLAEAAVWLLPRTKPLVKTEE